MTRRLVIQISDLHLVPSGELRPGVDPLANLDQLLGRLEALPRPPEVLLLSGDLTNASEPAAYELLRRRVGATAAKLGAVPLYLPGNHDSRAALRVHLLGEAASEAPIDKVTWCGGLRLITLDSTVAGSEHGELSDSQLEWLGESLANSAEEGSLLALHHPPVPSPIESMGAIALRDPERLGAVIAGRDVLVVCCGHNHHASSGLLAGVPVSVAPALSYRADPLSETSFLGLPGGGFSRIDIEDGRALVTYVPL